MGLAGILTIALIVSADQSYAGVNGLRAVTAYPAAAEQDQAARPPVLGGLIGLLDGVRELPVFAPPAATPGDGAAPAAGVAVPAASATATPRSAAGAPPAARPAPSPTAAPSATPAPPSSPTPAPSTPAPAAAAPTAPPAAPATPAPIASATPASALSLTTDRGATAVVNVGDLVPGDTLDRTITLKNTGTVGFRYAIAATQTASTPLWTDPANGLRLTVAASDGTVLYSGPVSSLGSLAIATTLPPGATELLRYTFAFPPAAPDTFQGLLQDLTLVFTATQYP